MSALSRFLTLSAALFAGPLLGIARAQDAAPAPPQAVPVNGDFEKADPQHPGKPAGWEALDGLAVQWTDAPVLPGAPPHGKAIRMNTALSEQQAVASYAKAGLTQWVFPHPADSPIAATYGVSLYSEPIPVLPGKVYHITLDYLAEKGTAGKLWVRGYASVNGQLRRSYEGTVNCSGPAGAWQHISGVFHPTRHTPNVTVMKLMLFAYYPPGVVWFDNVHVEAADEPQEQ